MTATEQENRWWRWSVTSPYHIPSHILYYMGCTTVCTGNLLHIAVLLYPTTVAIVIWVAPVWHATRLPINHRLQKAIKPAWEAYLIANAGSWLARAAGHVTIPVPEWSTWQWTYCTRLISCRELAPGTLDELFIATLWSLYMYLWSRGVHIYSIFLTKSVSSGVVSTRTRGSYITLYYY